MLKNYIKISLRNLIKHKTYSGINILGLSIGMTVSLIMLMYVIDALSYDTFHEDYEKINRVAVIWKSETNPMKFAGAMPAISPALNEAFPNSLASTRIQKADGDVEFRLGDKTFIEKNVFYAEQQTFDVFTYPFISGDVKNALTNPYSVVVTKSEAEKLFGDKEPINETIEFGEHQLIVTGVIEDIPANTHIDADMFISFNTLEAMNGKVEHPWNKWGQTLIYFKIKDATSSDVINSQLAALFKSNAGDWMAENFELIFQPLEEIHWLNGYSGDIGTKDNKMNVYIFLFASIIIMVIACFNFMNLSIARFIERMKEVGVRKVIGAKRSQLIFQFLVESIIISLFAIVVSIFVFESFNTNIYNFFGKHIILEQSHYSFLYLIIISMIIFAGVIAGGYPAIYLSGFKPALAIKNNILNNNRKFSFRKIAVVTQFVFSSLLIFGTLVIFSQLNFMRSADLGYEKENVFLIKFSENEQIEKYELLKGELKNHSSVKSVAGTYTVAGVNTRENKGITAIGEGEKETLSMQTIAVDYDFISTMSADILEGRNFSKEFSLDATESVILNEKAVSALGLENPTGKKLKVPGSENPCEIIGVVKDFHIQSLKEEIPPLLLYIKPTNFYSVLVKTSGNNRNVAQSDIEETWASIFPYSKIDLTTLEDSYEQLYVAEERTSNLLMMFAFFGIFISTLGLFGLSAFAISRKTREIGVRKVLGASVTKIVMSLSKEFAAWVFVAIIIAVPIAYYSMNKWLENFAYHIDIGVTLFVVANFIVFTVAILTVIWQSAKAASVNPVKSLRSE